MPVLAFGRDLLQGCRPAAATVAASPIEDLIDQALGTNELEILRVEGSLHCGGYHKLFSVFVMKVPPDRVVHKSNEPRRNNNVSYISQATENLLITDPERTRWYPTAFGLLFLHLQ